MRIWSLPLVLVLALPGCLGGGEPDDEAEPASDNGTGDGSAAGGATGEDPSPAQPTTRWVVENRTGTAQSIAVADVLILTGVTEEFTVEEGDLQLVVNITAEPGDLLADLVPPRCRSDDPAQQTSNLLLGCEGEVDASTSGDSASAGVSAPEPGPWVLELFCTGLGPCSVDYALSIAREVPV